MAITRFAVAVLLAGLLGLCACDKTPTPADSGYLLGLFPHAVGMLWIYEVYDSLTQATDTVWVSVTDTVSYEAALRWRMYWAAADSVAERRAFLRGDTIDLYSDEAASPVFLVRFVWPVSMGAVWTGPFGIDTSRVADTETVVVPAGHFPGSARIERSWNTDFEGGGNWSQTWVAQDVGIVRKYVHHAFSDGTQITITVNQSWELLRYHLSTFAFGQFPNTVGTQWTYRVMDVGNGWEDTVTVTVATRMQLAWADSVTVWHYAGRLLQDTMYVATIGDQVHVVPDTMLRFGLRSWYYRFPLAVGRHWGMILPPADHAVDDKGPISTPAGDFAAGFHYTMRGGVLNEYWGVDDWLVPDVGLVVHLYWEFPFSGPRVQQEWVLLNFQSPDSGP
jgi:hypothetical protein